MGFTSMDDYDISDYNYFGSTLGNAYFSGVTFEELWECVRIAKNREQFDAAVGATIRLHELVEEKNVK
jgi:hypothetical protein